MCVEVWIDQCFHVEIRGQFMRTGSLFHHVGLFGDRTSLLDLVTDIFILLTRAVEFWVLIISLLS